MNYKLDFKRVKSYNVWHKSEIAWIEWVEESLSYSGSR